MITIQIYGQADDAQRVEHLIRPLFDVTGHKEPQVTGDLCWREIQVEFIPVSLLEWHCPLCGEDMPDLNKVGHLISSHDASREIKRPWKINDDAENITRLEEHILELNTFRARQETRPQALFAAVRNLVRDAENLLRAAVKTYRED